MEHGPQRRRNVCPVRVVEQGVLLPGGGEAPLDTFQPPEHVEGNAVFGDAVTVHDLCRKWTRNIINEKVVKQFTAVFIKAVQGAVQ